MHFFFFFFFQADDGIRVSLASRGLGEVYKRQDPQFRQSQPSPYAANWLCHVTPFGRESFNPTHEHIARTFRQDIDISSFKSLWNRLMQGNSGGAYPSGSEGKE